MAEQDFSLVQETTSEPTRSESAYVAIGEAAEQKGGGFVYLSRNRKQRDRWETGKPKPPVHLTSEVGSMQQSIPFRAIGTAIAQDVLPLNQIIDVLVSSGRTAELVALIIAADRAAVVDALPDDIFDDDDSPEADTEEESLSA